MTGPLGTRARGNAGTCGPVSEQHLTTDLDASSTGTADRQLKPNGLRGPEFIARGDAR